MTIVHPVLQAVKVLVRAYPLPSAHTLRAAVVIPQVLLVHLLPKVITMVTVEAQLNLQMLLKLHLQVVNN